MEKIFEKYLQLNHIQRGEIPEDARLMSLAQFKLAAAEIVKNERERIENIIAEAYKEFPLAGDYLEDGRYTYPDIMRYIKSKLTDSEVKL